MRAAYAELHRLGHAHSIEVLDRDGRLVGGIYGVAIGRMFFAESMFSADSGGSKVALAALALRLPQWGWPLVDAQLETPHLVRLGAEAWPRPASSPQVPELVDREGVPVAWRVAFGTLPPRTWPGRASKLTGAAHRAFCQHPGPPPCQNCRFRRVHGAPCTDRVHMAKDDCH